MSVLKKLAAGAALALGLATAAWAEDPLKVGFIYVGPVNDGGWSQHHHEAAMEMAAHFGDKVEILEQESVPEGADAVRAISQMALAGAKIIFTTSFGYMDATIEAAEKFPDVKFEHATGYKTADNVGVYSARFYEGRAIEGYLAGKMTQSNKIGYIGSYPIPEVIRGINSSFHAAKLANPDVTMSVVWLNTWFDPAKEADATQAMIDQGIDVVLQHTDSTAPQITAQKAGNVYTFGQAADMAEFAPMPRISSIIDVWAPYYIARVQAVMDGTWTSDNTWDGIGAGMVGIGEISDAVPADVKAEAEKLRDDIASGAYHPFTGPINKQDGSQWLAEGETADDGTLAGMNFYIEGITDTLPQ